MDVVLLSRLQFAVTVFFHFIFVPLTLGLSVLIAMMETAYVRTGNDVYKSMAKFWGKLFLLNFALGVVTGITLEFQFGTNWSRYSAYVGDVFGSLLAIEASVAFFLESTFIAVWAFGWDRISKRMHLAAIWAVAIGGNVSALWIIFANGWMQHPVGYVLRNGRAELDDFLAVISNPYAWGQFFHTVSGCWALGGFFVLGVSAWHLVRKQHVDFFTRSVRFAAPFTLILTLAVAGFGHYQGQVVAKYQPAKLAAMESHWQTERSAPIYILTWPNLDKPGNAVQALPIPGLLSMMAYNSFDAEVRGLDSFPEQDRPPVLLPFLSFRLMVGLGSLFILLAFVAWWKRNEIGDTPWLAHALIWSIPLPYLCIMTGWTLAEVGRQPWIVHGLMRTTDAVSPVAASSVTVSLVAFIVIYGLLGILDIYLLRKFACEGPKPAA